MTIDLGANQNLTLSATALYTLLTLLVIGVWTVAVILTNMRNDLRGGRRTDKVHGRRLDDHALRLNLLDKKQENIKTDDLDD